ncbi:unnamed protein product [Pedinophyceae sp. YPF-701]|nr:unnamed protein product [Pedinophyceae sp. YPF-701]
MSAQTKGQALIEMCNRMRVGNDALDWRETILESERVECFRAKDYLRYMSHPQNAALLDALAALLGVPQDAPDLTGAGYAAGSPVARASAVLSQLARRGAVVKADRFSKKLREGQKKLPKWPKRLIPAKGDAVDPALFYVWTFARPSSPWSTIISILVAVGIMSACLLPIAPMWVKWGVLYLAYGFLGVIFGFVGLRAAIFAVLWIAAGYHLWVMPLIFDDRATIADAFTTFVNSDYAAQPASALNRALVATAVSGLSVLAVKFGNSDSVASVRDGMAANIGRTMDFFNMGGEQAEAIGSGEDGDQPYRVRAPFNPMTAGSFGAHSFADLIQSAGPFPGEDKGKEKKASEDAAGADAQKEPGSEGGDAAEECGGEGAECPGAGDGAAADEEDLDGEEPADDLKSLDEIMAELEAEMEGEGLEEDADVGGGGVGAGDGAGRGEAKDEL